MRDREDLVEELLARITDGMPVDWPALESDRTWVSSDPLLAEIRVIAGVAEISRTASWQPDEPGSASRLLTWRDLKILERIGHGSFGDVFRAWDSRLDRLVALKVLRPTGPHADVVSTSIIAEGRLLARVHHPNVVTVHSADSFNGLVGIVMELIEGRTLAEIVAEAPLEVERAAVIGADVCRALAAVHAAGLLHRDVKAQNVKVEPGGRVVLMDFGAGAEVAETARDAAGTPLYTAPELFTGAEPTPKTDVYSAGVLLYHLLTGAFPVDGRTAAELVRAHRLPRPAVRDLAPAIPEPLADILERALAPDPSRRFDTAAAMTTALTRFVEKQSPTPTARRPMVAYAAGLSAAIALAVWSVVSPALPFAPRDFVMLVPLENRTGDPALQGLADAALERELTQSRHLNLVSAGRIDDTLRLMRRPLDTPLTRAEAREVALRDGGTRAVIAGTVDRHQQGYVLRIDLQEPQSGQVIGRYLEPARDVAGLATAARRVSTAIREQLGEPPMSRDADATLELVSTASLEALRAYSASFRLGTRLEGRSWKAALELAREAVALDPTFAAAQIWMAWALYNTGAEPAEYRRVAAVAKTLADSASSWERHWVRGSVFTMLDDHESAALEYEALLRSYPDHYWGVWNLIASYQRLGRHNDAVALAEGYLSLRPTDPLALWRVIVAHQRAGLPGAVPALAERRRALVPLDERPQLLLDAWVRLIAAREAFDRRDLSATVAELDRIHAALHAEIEPRRRELVRHLAFFYVAVGRPRTCFLLAAYLPEAERTVYEAAAYLASGDGASASRAIERVSPRDLVAENPAALAHATWVSVQAGADNAPAFLETYAIVTRDAHTLLALRGTLALVQGNVRHAIELLEGPAQRIPGGNNIYFRTVTAFATALARAGQSDRAADILTTTLETIRAEGIVYPTASHWMPGQLLLARLERQRGNHAAAERLEHDLRALLSQAQPDFPLLREFQAVSRHGTLN
jgi:hypothetical protein